MADRLFTITVFRNLMKLSSICRRRRSILVSEVVCMAMVWGQGAVTVTNKLNRKLLGRVDNNLPTKTADEPVCSWNLKTADGSSRSASAITWGKNQSEYLTPFFAFLLPPRRTLYAYSRSILEVLNLNADCDRDLRESCRFSSPSHGFGEINGRRAALNIPTTHWCTRIHCA